MSALDAFITERMPDWVARRRDLHRHPELGFTEYRTIASLAERLEALGYSLRLGPEVMLPEAMIGAPVAATIAAARASALADGARADFVERMPDGTTALVAELRRGEGPVIAMRFDVDALPLQEQAGERHLPDRLGFRSANAGVMHACGHDGHATIGVGLAEAALRPEAAWTGTLRLVFQPAEEGGRGARPMAEAGVVDDADAFFALHIGCDLPSGKVATQAVQMMFSGKWNVTFHGVSAHAAANPERGANAILAAAQAVTGLYGLPRHGRYPTHVNVGRIEGGAARNAIADRAFLEIEVRGSEMEALLHMEGRARRLIEATAAAHGCSVDIVEMGRTIGAASTPGATGLVGTAAAAIGAEVLDEWQLGGGDDAAFFMQRVAERGGEAAYLILGSDLAAGHHATNFDFVEADIGTGVRLLATLLDLASAEIRPPR